MLTGECYYCGDPCLGTFHQACADEEARIMLHWAMRDSEPTCSLCGECRHVCESFDQALRTEAQAGLGRYYASEADPDDYRVRLYASAPASAS